MLRTSCHSLVNVTVIKFSFVCTLQILFLLKLSLTISDNYKVPESDCPSCPLAWNVSPLADRLGIRSKGAAQPIAFTFKDVMIVCSSEIHVQMSTCLEVVRWRCDDRHRIWAAGGYTSFSRSQGGDESLCARLKTVYQWQEQRNSNSSRSNAVKDNLSKNGRHQVSRPASL